MKIGVLGAGRMAEGLVPLWTAAGHEVLIGGRTHEKTAKLAELVGARAGTLRDAAEFGDVLFLAVLEAGVDATLRDAGAAEGALEGKVVIDCSNQIEHEHFTLSSTTSVSERVAEASGALVAKAFNQVHYDVWRQRASFAGQRLVVPIAGDEAAKRAAARLVRDAGAEPLDVGGLEQASNLEAIAAVVIKLLFGGAAPLSAFQFMVGTPAAA